MVDVRGGGGGRRLPTCLPRYLRLYIYSVTSSSSPAREESLRVNIRVALFVAILAGGMEGSVFFLAIVVAGGMEVGRVLLTLFKFRGVAVEVSVRSEPSHVPSDVVSIENHCIGCYLCRRALAPYSWISLRLMPYYWLVNVGLFA
eukprot:scaffold17608_cov75-Cyclotella_meneghiniana.AAC.10